MEINIETRGTLTLLMAMRRKTFMHPDELLFYALVSVTGATEMISKRETKIEEIKTLVVYP